jgi:hypothetical protein
VFWWVTIHFNWAGEMIFEEEFLFEYYFDKGSYSPNLHMTTKTITKNGGIHLIEHSYLIDTQNFHHFFS